jgi:hypothetical protein
MMGPPISATSLMLVAAVLLQGHNALFHWAHVFLAFRTCRFARYFNPLQVRDQRATVVWVARVERCWGVVLP